MKKNVLKLSVLALVAVCAGCNNKPLNLETSEMTIVSGTTQQIVVSPSVEGCTFTTGSAMIAPVSADGKVTGRIIGETVVRITNDDRKFQGECKVKVTPQYQMYQEPCLEFGATIAQVKAFEKRRLFAETETQLAYAGENESINAINYNFEDSKLKTSVALLYKTSDSPKLLVNFLKERYIMLSTSELANTFQSLNQKIVGATKVSAVEDREYLRVAYGSGK